MTDRPITEAELAASSEVMHCPRRACRRQHLDGRWWAHHPHVTHTCRFCGCKWDSDRPLIGVTADKAGLAPQFEF